MVVPYGVSLLAWFYFFYAIWGSPLPQAPYGALVQTDLKNLVFGAPGLFFDQEYGLLPYAPVYVLAATGLWAMWRERRDVAARGDRDRRDLRGAARHGRRVPHLVGRDGVARPSADVGPAAARAADRRCVSCRAGRRVRGAPRSISCSGSASGSAGVLLFAEDGFLIANGRDGTSALLEYLSPRWPPWTMAPSFIYHEAPRRWRTRRRGSWSAWPPPVAIVRVRAAHARHVRRCRRSASRRCVWRRRSIVMPRLAAATAVAGVDVRARGRVPLLDEFDTTRGRRASSTRRCGWCPPSDVVARASLGGRGRAAQGSRSQIRVLHNGRFSLPAGSYRVEIDWDGTRAGETIGLQIGRTGEPWQSWPVDPRPGERWTTEFTLPVDASFVGLRGTPELERIVRHVLDHPARDRRCDAASPDLRSARRFAFRCGDHLLSRQQRLSGGARLLGPRRTADPRDDSREPTATRR